MITAWRLTKIAHADEPLSGRGAFLYGGRWNPAGIPMVYFSDSLALAALEVLVHLRSNRVLMQQYLAVQVAFPEQLVASISREELPEGWRKVGAGITQELGRDWVRSATSAVLGVPSAVVPLEYNYLVNPGHPDFIQVDVAVTEPFYFDGRLG